MSEGCTWRLSTGGGWCEEVGCWQWDGWKGGSQDACEGNGTKYSLDCKWDSNGFCFPDRTMECSNLITERECMDSFYCWWKFSDWNDPSQGGNCSDPGEAGTIFEAWNPGCYIFDMNATNCNATIGCNYSVTESKCLVEAGHDFETLINDNGINCTLVNSSSLCNNIPMLSTCCEWLNGTCGENKMTTKCWDDMEPLPEGVTSCEDVSMKGGDTPSALCNKLAGDPWHMPCKWDNATSSCVFKGDNVFGNRTQSFALIDNQKTCEAAGGKWYVDNYCEGNQSVPAGRCEQKGRDEKNCDKACFACEYDFDGKVHNTTQTASEYCYGSKLGYCEFVTNSTAPNGQGYCRAKDAFKKGIVSDCQSDCASCTYMGNPNASSASGGTSYDSCNTPKCYCERAYLFSKVKCKWIADTSSDVGGYCMDSNVNTCNDACDRCYSQDDCQNKGRSGLNATGSCSWSSSQEKCSKTGEIVEVCWDGISNNNNTLIDCADPQCFGDSFCGFVSGDCFGWPSQTDCENNNCTWMTDPWSPGGWCDFPGADCWNYDGNETECMARNTTCDWSFGSGSGMCEQDWSLGESCYMLMTNASCAASASNCYWTTDSWCNGTGAGTDWCTTQGGWCDPASFKPKNCWLYDTNSTACASAAGCMWQGSEWGASCEVDWSGASGMVCMNYSTSTTCNDASEGCAWRTSGGMGGEFCDNKFMKCWDYTSSGTCGDDTNCRWDSWMNSCQAKCFNPDLTQSSCNDITGCRWSDGWCSDDWSSGGAVNCWNGSTGDSCNAMAECKWKSPGWCNPNGFAGGDAFGGMGMGATTGMECWKYDGNESMCTNEARINMTCSWMSEFRPFCEPDWSSNCFEYPNYGNCSTDNSCYWKNSSGAEGNCMNGFDLCWENASLSTNNTACNDNSYCNWTTGFGAWGDEVGGSGWCEPTCFSASDQDSCTGSCKWMTGWCSPPGTNDMFTGMEMGAPVMIAMDDCSGNEVAEGLVDMCGAGLKDMGASFGFASSVRDFSQAGICKNEKIGFGSSNQFGNGNKTVKYYVYLDTDGSTSGGCRLAHDSSQEGYEFFFKLVTEWDDAASKPTKTFTAQRCLSNAWTTADITLDALAPKLCGEVQGMMIAAMKVDLEKFPSLYDSSKDMRIYAAMANITSNMSSPSDTAGPGWVTPGAVDFDVQGFFEKGADAAKFEDILMNCFVKYEDCFNGVDDDDDGKVDCSDWDCQLMSQCASSGVNLETDTSMPRITGVNVEEYTDAALVTYYTDKPTNGTLTFWHNDSTCSSTYENRTINDTGIMLDSVREYKLWHTAELFNDSGVTSPIDYVLESNTAYYYKLKICDYNGKCSVSACTNFTTAESVAKCAGYCNFVTKIRAPTGWTVSYDLDTNGTFEHVQGCLCGPNAGMKTNYSSGRKAHIKLNNSDGGEFFFYNVTLSRTGLSVHTRNITGSDSLIYNDTVTDSSGNAIGLVGMIGETRDKIVNNLHPEVCRITVPRGATDCTALWHCDDAGNNCVNRTSEATAISSTATTCTWQIPYCEFSTYGSGEPGTPGSGTTTTSSGGGGGGGGGGTAVGAREIFTYKEIESGTTIDISPVNEQMLFRGISFKAIEALKDTRVTVSREMEKPDDTPEDVPADVFGYMRIQLTNIPEEKIESPKIVFKVNKSWIRENGILKDSVRLYRYVEGKAWVAQTTKLLSEADPVVITYEATPRGFSYFAIGGKTTPEEVEEEVVEEEEEPVEEITGEVVAPVAKEPWKFPEWKEAYTIAVIIALGVAVFVVFVFAALKRRESLAPKKGRK